jgi:hypothetical protein
MIVPAPTSRACRALTTREFPVQAVLLAGAKASSRERLAFRLAKAIARTAQPPIRSSKVRLTRVRRPRSGELDYFEQLGALEKHGGFDFELIRTLLGRRLVDRWEMWQPSIDAIGGSATYPMFERLAAKMRAQA